ncbi:hypothetical protein [Pendulispora albinea]|uniref:Lipoprotein n=1 Tax=Pendulispora albinea TaxID=2741071 RepID=A0ABZ2M8L1_9BACT
MPESTHLPHPFRKALLGAILTIAATGCGNCGGGADDPRALMPRSETRAIPAPKSQPPPSDASTDR